MIPKCSTENVEAATAKLCIIAQIKGRSKGVSNFVRSMFRKLEERGLDHKSSICIPFTSLHVFGVFLTHFGRMFPRYSNTFQYWRYTNTDLKICQYLRLHLKIICGKFYIRTPFTFWDMCTWDMWKVCLQTFQNNRLR